MRYYSTFVNLIVLIWGIGYIGDITTITNYVHPYHISLFAAVGFTGLLWYWTSVQNYQFDMDFIIRLSLLHYIPLYITYKYSQRRYGLYLLVTSLTLYMCWMCSIKRSPINTYLKDTIPTSWSEMVTWCRKEKEKPHPVCYFISHRDQY